jgi:hypothetical protein
MLDVMVCKSDYAACLCLLCCLDSLAGIPCRTVCTGWLCWLFQQSHLVNLTIRLVVLAMLATKVVLAVYGIYGGYVTGYADFTSWPFWLAIRSECAGG